MTRIASRYADALKEAQAADRTLNLVRSSFVNFGDAADPDALAARLLDMVATLDAAAGHYRAAASLAKAVRREGVE